MRIDFLDLSLAPPNGDGTCNTDLVSITGGASVVPNICGENSGQHVYVNFDGTSPIVISITATSTYTLGRHWHIKTTQISCDSPWRGKYGLSSPSKLFFTFSYSIAAPAGCLQYHMNPSGVVRGFNYSPSANSLPNGVGVEGTRQLANLAYGICVNIGVGQCSITWSTLSSDIYSFTLTGDVGAVDPTLLGTSSLQQQTCNTDYIIIPNAIQNKMALGSDRFCGLGLAATTSKKRHAKRTYKFGV